MKNPIEHDQFGNIILQDGSFIHRRRR